MRPRFRPVLAALLLAVHAAAAPGPGAAGPFRPVRIEGVENAFAVGPRLFSGSAPDGDAAFAALARLGVRTLVSVDGAAPDVAAAARHGLRYVHIPVGYDGIARTNALRLAKAAAASDGPVFVHCHHGQHRGPAAVAVVCEALEGWSPAVARDWMLAAGTSTNYAGLYRTAATFAAPSPAELAAVPAEFPSRAPTPALVDAMVAIDAHADALKASRKAGFRPVASHPDAVPSGEALQVLEGLREARRTGAGAGRGKRFEDGLAEAEDRAARLVEALKALEAGRDAASAARAEEAFQATLRSCAACHKATRD